MPVSPRPAVVLLSLIMIVTTAAMFPALYWAIRRILSRRPLLPPAPDRPRIVPWGVASVVAVIASWFVVNLAVSEAYLRVRSTIRIAEATRPSSMPPKPKSSKTVALTTTPEPILSFTEQMVLASAINGILIVAVPFGLRLGTGSKLKDLGLATEQLERNVKAGVVAFLAITPVVMGVNVLAQLIWKPNRHPVELMLREAGDPVLIVLAYLAAVVLAPAAEEILFRGVIQGWLRRVFERMDDPSGRFDPGLDTWADDREIPPKPRSGFRLRWMPRLPLGAPTRLVASAKPYQESSAAMTGAEARSLVRLIPNSERILPILLTSVLFAVVHYQQMPAPLAIFPLALVLGLLYETTGSLVGPLVLHALFNGFNTTALVVILLIHPEIKP